MPALIYFLLAIHVIMCALMILVTLMQRPRSEGLGAAFGGGMTDNIFGAQTTNVLAKATTWLGGAFFVVTLVLAMLYARQGTNSETQIQKELKSMPAPAAETAPAASESSASSDALTPAPATESADPAAAESTLSTLAAETEAPAATPAGALSEPADDAMAAPAVAPEPAAAAEPTNSLVIPEPAPAATPE